MQKKILFGSLFCLLLTACSSFFDKDNMPPPAPLTAYTPEIGIKPLWYTDTGFGVGANYLKLPIAIENGIIYTANANGNITATNAQTGKIVWHTSTGFPISGGPLVDNNFIFVSTPKGLVLALNMQNGQLIWKKQVSSEALAPPNAARNILIIKAIDGGVYALSEQTGQMLWNYQQTEPNLILRGASKPLINQDSVIVGFANGNIAKLSLTSGSLLWQQTIATPQGSFPVQRMVDIDADPILMNDRIYAVTYQGQLAALDYFSGKIIWTHDMSSYSGMVADQGRIYVTDAASTVFALDAETGQVDWQQSNLAYRNLTAPALMGNQLVMGDGQGYIHWLNKDDGHLMARKRIDNAGILAQPVSNNNILYVLSREGRLAGYLKI